MENRNFEEIENEFYRARYGMPRSGNIEELWNQIKKDPEVLKKAIQVKRNKWDNGNLLEGMTIAEAILIEPKEVGPDIYQQLIDTIYKDPDIARLSLGVGTDCGDSFLVMSLWNPDLNLTEEQKNFVVNEAMKVNGTARQEAEREEYSKQLEENGITDDITSVIEVGGSLNPIGAKTKCEYLYDLFSSLRSESVYGRGGSFDIRYWILKNKNWTTEEKQKLVMEFWQADQAYDECLEDWEWAVVNDSDNYKGEPLPPFDKYDLFYEWTYDMLLAFHRDKDITDRIWKEMEFCKQMHQLRPQQWEIGSSQSAKNASVKKINLN